MNKTNWHSLTSEQQNTILWAWRLWFGQNHPFCDEAVLSYDSAHFDAKRSQPIDNSYKARAATEIFDFLCVRGPWSFNKQDLKRLFLRQDKEFLGYFFVAIQEELLSIYGDILKKNVSDNFATLRINNMLCFLTYTECYGHKIRVPTRSPVGWLLTSYHIQCVPLVPAWTSVFATPYSAYGLVPEDKHSPSLLLFMGSTYPSATGSWWTYLADFFPGLSIGKILFLVGKQRLRRWIVAQERTVECHGQSLGGSLSIFCAAAFPEFVQAYAHVPPGRWLGRYSRFQGQNVTVSLQVQDPITQLGDLPQQAEYWFVVPHPHTVTEPSRALQKADLGVWQFSHAVSFISHPKAQLLTVSPHFQMTRDRQKRWVFVWWGLCLCMFPVLCLWAISRLTHQIFKKLTNISIAK